MMQLSNGLEKGPEGISRWHCKWKGVKIKRQKGGTQSSGGALKMIWHLFWGDLRAQT